MALQSKSVNSSHPPLLGFGTYNKLRDHRAMADAVRIALEVGYRHIDCAQFYANEDLIGEVLQQAFKDKIVKREDLYITSKVWNHDHAPKDVVACLEERLKLLQVDYLDLFLLHWPISFKKETYKVQLSASDPFFAEHDDTIPLIDTWRALEAVQRTGKVRAIGVSNFSTRQLKELLSVAEIPPVTNQVECHPFQAQSELLALCKAHGITLTAFCPLGKPGVLTPTQPNLLQDPIIKQIAAKHSRTPAQIVLRWNIERGVSVIPKSVQPERIRENYGVHDFELDAADHQDISQLDQGIHLNCPAWVEFGENTVWKSTYHA